LSVIKAMMTEKIVGGLTDHSIKKGCSEKIKN
jgi:hypothetical protein